MPERGPRSQPKSGADKYRINEEITARDVRVIGAGGEQLGIMTARDAMRVAETEGYDLVEVAPEAAPPVCKLLDYGKLKYREQKKAAETRKRSSTHSVKELRVRYSTDKHDLETKLRKAREFLDEGDRVKFQMRFRGREVTYKELGEAIFKQIAEQLQDIALIEDFSPLLGNRMNMILVPKSLAKEAAAKSK